MIANTLFGEIKNKEVVVSCYYFSEKEKISIYPRKNLITKINRVIRMVLRGLDDVSEIAMRA